MFYYISCFNLVSFVYVPLLFCEAFGIALCLNCAIKKSSCIFFIITVFGDVDNYGKYITVNYNYNAVSTFLVVKNVLMILSVIFKSN